MCTLHIAIDLTLYRWEGVGVVRGTKQHFLPPLPPLMGANPLQGPWEGVGPENLDFFGPNFRHEKSRFSGPTLSNGPCKGFALIKFITSRAI